MFFEQAIILFKRTGFALVVGSSPQATKRKPAASLLNISRAAGALAVLYDPELKGSD